MWRKKCYVIKVSLSKLCSWENSYLDAFNYSPKMDCTLHFHIYRTQNLRRQPFRKVSVCFIIWKSSFSRQPTPLLQIKEDGLPKSFMDNDSTRLTGLIITDLEKPFEWILGNPEKKAVLPTVDFFIFRFNLKLHIFRYKKKMNLAIFKSKESFLNYISFSISWKPWKEEYHKLWG